MPIYEYECKKCSLEFEVKRGFGENSGAICPRCKGESRRIFSPVPVFFKGPGFYVTDNASAGRNSPSNRAAKDKAVDGEKQPAPVNGCSKEVAA